MLNKNKEVILIHGSTFLDKEIRGIQRVFINLFNNLIENGHYVIPVWFDIVKKDLVPFDCGEGKIEYFIDNGLKDEPYLRDIEFQKSMIKNGKIFIKPDIYAFDNVYMSKFITYLKYNNIKSSAIFHDAMPLIVPNMGVYIQDASVHMQYMFNLLKYDFIFTVSEHSKKDFIKLLPNSNTNKIKTLMLADEFSIKKEENTKLYLSKNINMIFVSSMEKRKNHLMLIEVFEIARDILLRKNINLTLTLVASAEDKICKNRINNSKHKNSINKIIKASDEELAKQYNLATFSVFPSEYEGFGLPVMESMYFNRPCIVADNSSLLELSKRGGCITFKTNDKNDLLDKILKMSTDDNLYKSLINSIKDIKFKSWNTYAKEIINEITNINHEETY